jgi:hypothetical protein
MTTATYVFYVSLYNATDLGVVYVTDCPKNPSLVQALTKSIRLAKMVMAIFGENVEFYRFIGEAVVLKKGAVHLPWSLAC